MDEHRKLSIFVALSQALTGFDDLPEDIGTDYLSSLSTSFGDQAMTGLLTRFEALLTSGGDIVSAIKTSIIDSQEFGALARELIMLWYTAQYTDTRGDVKDGTATQYYSSLIWQAIQAHPPGRAGGAYGYWTAPPEG